MTLNLELDFAPMVSYVMYQNRMETVLTAFVSNDGEPVTGARFRISSNPAFFREVTSAADLIDTGDRLDLTNDPSFKVELDPSLIMTLTERMESEVTLEVSVDGEVIASATCRVSVLPFDDWPGCEMAETIASFVTPNSPSLTKVRASASDIMRGWGKSPSLEGYQGDRDRVLTMGAAVFAALRRANINYVNPPAGFESRGQRVRLPDQVLENHEGTCLDLAVLYASALESFRLNPLIFFVNGHAFAGFWLVDETQSEIKSFDPSSATRMIRGQDMRAVECTMFTNAYDVNFEQACDAALRRLEDADSFICSVDIARSRELIRPLPSRRIENGEWVVERDEAKVSTTAPSPVGDVYDIPETGRPITKADRWKRELLDITNRNNMINMKQGTKVAPLLIKDVSSFEDALVNGAEFSILPRPQEWNGYQEYGARPFETELYIGNYSSMAGGDLSRGYIRTPMTEKDLERSIRSIYRLANKELEESGCNSLFIALGVLRWYEGRSTGTARYAPLVMIPAVLRKRQTGFSVKKLDEETLFNVTLIEKLRQEFDVAVPIPDPLPTDDNGVNVNQLLQIVRRSVAGKEGWDVLEGTSIGVFSFNQFVMWKDLDTHMDMLMQNDVVRCMVESVPYPEHGEILGDADPYGLCLTVSADGSQIRAVRAAEEGRTFVMHGPPGTGKSQTITNMICNALYHDKTVLFVAEKRAALEVVQKRLEEVGIGNHCLELHSNKSEKGKVLEQLKRSLDSCAACDPSQQKENVSSIRSLQTKLDGYVHALHQDRSWGLSAFDCISRYESHCTEGSREIQVSSSNLQNIDSKTLNDLGSWVLEACQAYDIVRDVDCEVLRSVRVGRAVASIGEDVEDAFSTAERAAKDLESARTAIMSCDLPLDPDDPARSRAVIDALMSIDPALSRRTDISTLPERLGAVEESSRSMSSYAASWSALGLSVRRENLSDALDRLQSMEASISVFTDGDFEGASVLVGMLRDLQRYCSTLLSHESEMSRVNVEWTQSVYDLDSEWNIRTAWNSANGAGLFSRGKARKEFLAKASGCLRNPNAKFETLGDTVAIIDRISGDIRSVSGIPGKYAVSMSSEIASIQERLSTMRTSAALARETVMSLDIEPSQLPSACATATATVPLMETLDGASKAWKRASSEVTSLLKTETDISTPEEFRDLRDSISPYIGRMFDWASWNSYAGRLRSAGIAAAVDLIYEGMDPELISDSVYRSVYKALINRCRQESEPLRAFSANSFEKLVRQFKSLDQMFTNLNRGLLRYKLYSNTPVNLDSSSTGSEAYTLYRAINSSRMRKSIRTLLSEIPNILPRICPCFLMSPQSVAQYITTDYPKFDLVIFDESSQITTSKAVGALGRAKSAVIAGDSRQLPPTSFFQKKIESTDDDDDMTDVESFLDDCLSLNMPQTYLEWHYRSRHESLITFSNREFYDNKMLTFPSPNDQETKVGMRRVDGVYEKGSRCNPIEAAAVVEDIRRRVLDPELCHQSIGVVAFSVSQQSCIQDALDDMVKGDSELFKGLSAMPEELFIKNLETVQGDERDVILFSIGYGPDSNGNVSQNFGPINREGGGRRLNVAVSRARSEMLVFSSMGHTDIKITPTSSKGVRYLRDFLRFAENGGRFNEVSERARMEQASSVLRGLSDFLNEQGYDTHYGIGSSDYKVDIAVVDPDDPSRYILGILNDGDCYKQSDNTRDREYAREDVLKNLGWRIVHVWSIDWYFNPERTKKDVMATLERLRSEPQEEKCQPETVDNPGTSDPPTQSVTEMVFASSPPPTASRSRRVPYTPFEPEPSIVGPDIAVSTEHWVNAIATPIIMAESPVNESLLISKFCDAVGIKRLSSQKRNVLTAKLRSLFHPEMNGGFVTYWAPGSDRTGITTYRVGEGEASRGILEVPLIEILNAIEDTVSASGSISMDDAATAVGRNLGYSRIGTNIRSTLNEALIIAVDKGIVKASNGRYMMPRGRGHTNESSEPDPRFLLKDTVTSPPHRLIEPAFDSNDWSETGPEFIGRN